MVLLSTQICNIKIRSSKPIIQSNGKMKVAQFAFACEFHDLKYFSIFLQFIIKLRTLLEM